MSYCRWSSDGYKCDVYVYEDVHGGWTTHVAGRKKAGLDTLPPDPLTLIGNMHSEEWLEAYRSFHEAYERLPFVDHAMAGAGETFNDDTPGECADRLERLREVGFYVPDYAIAALREEQSEMDGTTVIFNVEQPKNS